MGTNVANTVATTITQTINNPNNQIRQNLQEINNDMKTNIQEMTKIIVDTLKPIQQETVKPTCIPQTPTQ